MVLELNVACFSSVGKFRGKLPHDMLLLMCSTTCSASVWPGLTLEDRRISRWQAAEECPKAHSTRRESARGASEKKPPQLDAICFLLSERRDRIGFFFPNLGFGSPEYL